MRRPAAALLSCLLLCEAVSLIHGADEPPVTGRRPGYDAELEYWLRNALQAHRFSAAEAGLALDLTATEVTEACARLGINPTGDAPAGIADTLRVLPYPGGRHPRIGFLEGAIDPQRETKVSVFTPWQPDDRSRADYVVVDVPEALWSNLGLTYLAHTHIDTVWTKAGITLQRLEWTRYDDGSLTLERTLPNGIAFRTQVVPRRDHVTMQITLTNGTDEALTDLRVQNCVMLKGADGFNQQDNANKVSRPPWMAARHAAADRWILTAWRPNHRTWANARCPCLHSDPQFPDCPPGETQVIQGWLSFYEGTDLDAEIARIDALQWWAPDAAATN